MNKIVIDSAIPYIKGVFESYFDEVKYLSGKDILHNDVEDANALVVRTRTKCDEELLADTDVEIVASPTIGTDHIDIKTLFKNGVVVVNAPGCNAGGVLQYVYTTLFYVAQQKNIDLRGKTIGVIGAGNTGGRVYKYAPDFYLQHLENDPKREKREGSEEFCSLDYLLANSDIVSCHVPLDKTTFRMADAEFFSKMKDGAIFINASRGEIVVEEDLIAAARAGKFSAMILDVWNNESSGISKELLELADIATPHIAGYSIEGKINGTVMVVRALASYFGIRELSNFSIDNEMSSPLKLNFSQAEILKQMLDIFPVLELDKLLRDKPENFEKIRTEYKLRHEFQL